MRPGRERQRAFTSIDLTVVILLFAILIALIIPATAKAKAKAKRIGCVGHLKNIGLSYRIFATENKDRFPWQIETNSPSGDVIKYSLSISNELATPLILTCPADTRKPPRRWNDLTRSNISYFISPSSQETYPQSFLAGDRNLMTNGTRLKSGVVKISTNAILSWDSDMHRLQGNVTMGDGSVQQLSQSRLRLEFKSSGVSEMSLAVP